MKRLIDTVRYTVMNLFREMKNYTYGPNLSAASMRLPEPNTHDMHDHALIIKHVGVVLDQCDTVLQSKYVNFSFWYPYSSRYLEEV